MSYAVVTALIFARGSSTSGSSTSCVEIGKSRPAPHIVELMVPLKGFGPGVADIGDELFG